MGLPSLPATALKTPMSVYLTLVLCANYTSLTSSCSLAFIVDEFPRLPILSKLMSSTMRSTSLLAILRQTKASLLGPQVRRVRPRAEHNVRTYTFLPADTRYIRIWNITYVSYVYTYLVHTPESEKSRRRYMSSNEKSKRKCWYIYQVREQTIFYPNNP